MWLLPFPRGVVRTFLAASSGQITRSIRRNPAREDLGQAIPELT